jgi:hypothetical protein
MTRKPRMAKPKAKPASRAKAKTAPPRPQPADTDSVVPAKYRQPRGYWLGELDEARRALARKQDLGQRAGLDDADYSVPNVNLPPNAEKPK